MLGVGLSCAHFSCMGISVLSFVGDFFELGMFSVAVKRNILHITSHFSMTVCFKN